MGRVLLCLTALSLLGGSLAQGQTLLRWKFAPEQRYQIAGTQRTDVVTSISGKAQKAELDMTMELTWQVEAVDSAGVATMKQTFTRLAIKTTAPGAEPISFDSASAIKPSGAAKDIAAGVTPLLNVPFLVKMNARGDVQEVTLSDEAQKVLAELPADSQLKSILSPAGLTQLFRLGGSLPEQEVKAGDTWQAQDEAQVSGGVLKQETKFTLAAIDDKEGSATAQITFKGSDQFTPAEGAAKTLSIQEQTRSGEVTVNVPGGYVSESTSQLISKSERRFRNQIIFVTIDSKTQLQIKRQ